MARGEVESTVAAAAAAVRNRIGALQPRIAIILGSGLGGFTRRVDDPVSIPYASIPGFPASTVQGHASLVIAGRIGDVDVLAFAGRFHLYEGHPSAIAALPVRLAHALGVRTLFVSNAAGGIRRSFRVGDLMLIRDHINLMWRNPLAGPVVAGEVRFPDMSAPWDGELLALMRRAAREAGIPIVEGVYAALRGPSYETPAEIRMLELLGADAVGMSTVPEILAARAAGLRVAGVSCITNLASGMGSAPLEHGEVLHVAQRTQEAFERLVMACVNAGNWE